MNIGDNMMMDEQPNSGKLLDTTDNLEAVGVFRGWKNFLFIVLLLGLFVLQGSFWLVNTGFVRTGPASVEKKDVAVEQVKEQDPNLAGTNQLTVKHMVSESNDPNVLAVSEKTGPGFSFRSLIKFPQVAAIINLLNAVMIPASILYCLTMLFILKVSMLARLGGLNHISRAFFISLVFVVLLLPWQKLFPEIIFWRVIFTPSELVAAKSEIANADIFGKAFYYYKFSGHWLLEVILLLFSQIRSAKWARVILQRLEVI